MLQLAQHVVLYAEKLESNRGLALCTAPTCRLGKTFIRTTLFDWIHKLKGEKEKCNFQ
jgi:hypothetical protein